MSDTLTPAQGRALVALHHRPRSAIVRADVLVRLQALGLTGPGRTLTAAGKALAEDYAARHRAERSPAGRVDVVEVLLRVEAPTAPDGVVRALARMLLDLPTDADRVAAVSWLASTRGSGYLGNVKDAMIVQARRGRTYAQAAAYLGIRPGAVNRAVSRSKARRQPEVDTPSPMRDA